MTEREEQEMESLEVVLTNQQYCTCPVCDGNRSVLMINGEAFPLTRRSKRIVGLPCRNCLGWAVVVSQKYVQAARKLTRSTALPKPKGKGVAGGGDTWLIRKWLDNGQGTTLKMVSTPRGQVPMEGMKPTTSLLPEPLHEMSREDALEIILKGQKYERCPDCIGQHLNTTVDCAKCSGSRVVLSKEYLEACVVEGRPFPKKPTAADAPTPGSRVREPSLYTLRSENDGQEPGS